MNHKWRKGHGGKGWLLLCAVLTAGLLAAASQKVEKEEDSYTAAGKKVQLKIARDRIGVLTEEGVIAQDLHRLSPAIREGAIREYASNVRVLELTEAKDRKALIDLARELKAKGEKRVRQVGLVVTTEGMKTPMLLTDEFVVQFKPGADKEKLARLNKDHAVEVVRQNPFVKNQYLLRVTTRSEGNTLSVVQRYEKDPGVEFAHPNFVKVHEPRQVVPNDPLFADQWHHRNTGQGGGTPDADIDTPEAWAITTGSANVVVAVIDNGFDVTHPDLVPNLWVNPAEIPGNGIDDDGNGFIDDVNGWDFFDNDNTLAGGAHGTNVAGCVGARGNNKLGVSGTCPNCRLICIRSSFTDFDDGLAFGYAQAMGAQVITNSWGYPIGTPATPNVVAAINTAATAGRGGLGCVIFFAMNNPNVNDCGANPDISSLANVIAISRANAQDRFDLSGFGNCMDLLAPSRSQMTPTLPAIVTTAPGGGFTTNFSGTSAATPIAAGIAGLMLDVNPVLTRLQVQRLLQDTADKVEDSAGRYSTVTGFSTPTPAPATHGYGRVNAFEAVRVAATTARRGRGGADLVIRDNRLDWGNTEQPSNVLFESPRGFIPHWQSVDIKVDAPPFQAAPTTSAAFDAFIDEDPVASQTNRVYVRVRNRGPQAIASAVVKLHWAFAGTALPPLPPDFWTSFPGDSSDVTVWHPLGIQKITDLAYSGASVAGTPADAAQVVGFDFPAPAVDPTKPNPRHYCVLAIADSSLDPVSPASKATLVVDDITPRDNNITHRNLTLQDPTKLERFEAMLFVRNPTKEAIKSQLRVDAPEGWKVDLGSLPVNKPFPMEARKEVLVTIKVSPPQPGARGDVTVIQEQLGQEKKVMGGMTYRFQPQQQPKDPVRKP